VLLVVVVNEFFAKRHWPAHNAIGKRIKFDVKDKPWRAVAGVVQDIRERGLLLEMKPAFYVPIGRVKPDSYAFLVVRTAMDPTSAMNSVETAVWAEDAQPPVTQIRTMDEWIARGRSHVPDGLAWRVRGLGAGASFDRC
jgi:putative ABC transport system permease protein